MTNCPKDSGPALAPLVEAQEQIVKAGDYLSSRNFGNLGGGRNTKANLIDLNNDTYILHNL